MLTFLRQNLEDDFDYMQIQKSTYADDFHSIIQKLERMSPGIDCPSTTLVLYESYIGAVLGGQFQLGRLTRHEKFADVYEVTPLLAEDMFPMEAMVYDFRGCSVAARKRDLKIHRPFSVCEIDQGGKKYLVYYIDSRLSHEKGNRAIKKRGKRLESIKANESRRVRGFQENQVSMASHCDDSTPGGHRGDGSALRFMIKASQTNEFQNPTQRPDTKDHCADARTFDSEKTQQCADVWHCVKYRSSLRKRISNSSFLKRTAPGNWNSPNHFQTSTRKCPWRVHAAEFNSMDLEGCIEFEELLDFEGGPVFEHISDLNKAISKLSINYWKLNARLRMSAADSEFVPSGLRSLMEASRERWIHEYNKLQQHIRNLEGRAWLWYELQKELDDIRRLVCFIEEHLEVNADLPDLEWNLRRKPAIERQPEHHTWTESARFLTYLHSIHSKKPEELSRRYKELAKTMDYDHSIYLRNIWDFVLQQVKEGQIDGLADALSGFHAFESNEPTVLGSLGSLRGLGLGITK
ncbi:impB/mucB/samB family protein [Colletotrichum asianum]